MGRRLAAYGAFAWMVLFAVVHMYWLVGGTVGLPPGRKVTDNTGLLIADVIAVPLCIVGAAVALALARPDRARPRPRTLQRLGAGTAVLAVVHAATAMVSWALLPLGMLDGELSDEERFSLFLYEPFWLLGGILFALATWEYRVALRRRERITVREKSPGLPRKK